MKPEMIRTEATGGGWGRRESRAAASILFSIGDCLFLTGIGVTANVVMHLMHDAGWSFVAASLAGMVLSMLAQILLSLLVAPVLGSIESMVPSMVVAMTSPMSVCAAHLAGCELDQSTCGALGAGFGMGMFLFVQVYGLVCRRSLCQPIRR